ncbi:MAG: stage III sporulation protein AE [Firmicutes bacterium]|nr:stage III sporulation protein AE [Bacillota bacterium]
MNANLLLINPYLPKLKSGQVLRADESRLENGCPKVGGSSLKLAKRYKVILGLVLLAALYCLVYFLASLPMATQTILTVRDLGSNTGMLDMLDGLDLSQLEDIFSGLDKQQNNLLGAPTLLEKIKAIVNGDIAVDFGSFLNFIFYLCGIKLTAYLPIIVSIIAIALAYNVLSAIKGKFANESTDKVIYFVCISVVTLLLLGVCIGLTKDATHTVTQIKEQATAIFPILLTLMIGIGAESTALVYQPAVVILTTTMIEAVVLIALPIFMMSFVFSIVGNLSEGVRLKRLSEFFNSLAKWVLGTMFFVFLTFLSIQGITASVFDGISVRTAKFAIAKYVPIIGGYLSEGFNLVMAGGVLVKNAIGLSAILILAVTVLPLIVNLVVFALLLKFCAAIIEPMGDEKIPKILSQISKQCSILAIILIALSFLYFVFLLLVIATGNLML